MGRWVSEERMVWKHPNTVLIPVSGYSGWEWIVYPPRNEDFCVFPRKSGVKSKVGYIIIPG